MSDDKEVKIDGGKEEVIEKTPEQLMEEKKALFAKEPDMFVHLEELVVGAILMHDGHVAVMANTNSSRMNLLYSTGELTFVVQKTLAARELRSMKNKRIIQPGQGRGGFRNLFNKKK